jgi:hypothetical protein
MKTDAKRLLEDRQLGFIILMTDPGMKWMKSESGLQFLTSPKDDNYTFANVITFLRRGNSLAQNYATELNEEVRKYTNNKIGRDAFSSGATINQLQYMNMASQYGFSQPSFAKT